MQFPTFTALLLVLAGHTLMAQISGESRTVFNGGGMRVVVSTRGQVAHDATSEHGGLFWPGNGRSLEATRVLAHSSSPVFFGRVRGTRRVAVSHFYDTFIPGPVVNGRPVPAPTNPLYRAYVLRAGDTESRDYMEWPAQFGAPVDANGNPLFLGPAQMFWIMNDLDSATVRDRNGCAPLGLEMRMLLYEPVWHSESPDALLLQVTYVNKSADSIEEAYAGYFIDVDIRDGLTDLVGADSLHSMVYAYDGVRMVEDEGMPTAFGLAMLQTPAVAAPGSRARWFDGWKQDAYNIPVSAAIAPTKTQNSAVREPRVGEGHPYQWELLLQGRGGGLYVHDPLTNAPSRFWFSGDPVRETGWLPAHGLTLSDGQHLNQRIMDQRMLISAGPFRMAPGDTQQVTFAFVAARGATSKAAVFALRDRVELLRRRFDKFGPITSLREAAAASTPVTAGAGAVDARACFSEAPDVLHIEITDANGGRLIAAPLNGSFSDGVWTYVQRIPVPGDGHDGVNAAFVAGWGDDTVRIPAGVSIPTSGNVDIDGTVMIEEGDGNGRVAPDEDARWFPRLVNRTPFRYDLHLQSYAQPNSQWLRVTGLEAGVAAPSASYPWSATMGICTLWDGDTHLYPDTLVRQYDIFDPFSNVWWDLHHRIPFDSTTGDWFDVLMTQVAGRSDERPGVRILDPSALRDRWYVATIDGPVTARFLSLHDSLTGVPCFTGYGLDSFTGATPVVDGFRIVRGTITSNEENWNTALRADRYIFNPRHTLLAHSQKEGAEFSVSSPAPLPLAQWTSVRVTLPEATRLRAEVYNSLGRLVRVLRDDAAEAGRFLLIWDGYWDDAHPAESGMYLLRIRTLTREITHKVIIAR